jgi:nitroreductase
MTSTDMKSRLDLLTERVSHGALGGPGPALDQITEIVRAGLRAPDHGLLRPWRFVVIEGDRREYLGTVLQHSLRLRGVSDESQLAKALKAPERAPIIIAVMLQFKEHAKVERNEQIGSAAAAAYAMSLASNALGFGSMWRTGVYATDPTVVAALGGDVQDEVIGFLYLGTREGPSKKLPALDPADFMTHF